MPVSLGINGFGRIGRCFLRASMQKRVGAYTVDAVNDLTDGHTLAHLLKYDSVHREFPGEVVSETGALVVNNRRIAVSAVKEPAEIPWRQSDVEVVVESTGRFTDREKAAKHLSAGVKRVIVSAPCKGADGTFVYGVNHDSFDPGKHLVVSNASCTTNCMAIVAKVLLERFGIERGVMSTIHSYTNDQQLLDLPHKDLRRARAAALSIIPTSTGAAKAVGEVLPQLRGKLDGMAYRVPTPNVSVVDFTCTLERNATAEDLNRAFEEAAAGPLQGILQFSTLPLVSVDFSTNSYSAIVDAEYTRVVDGKLVKVVAWYDNEWGYSSRLADFAAHVVERSA